MEGSHKRQEDPMKTISKLGEGKSFGGLGFQDLHAFNKAMLAKQLWRILKYPESLVTTILRNILEIDLF